MERLLKILVIGDTAVGKTSFIQRYVDNIYRPRYKATLSVDFSLKIVRWSDEEILKLQIWDIAGQERYTAMTRVYYKDANACIIMFDVTRASSFENALKWKKDLDKKCHLSDGSNVPCILLANKCDLPNREVNESEIEAFSKQNNFTDWIEISVKNGIMIEGSMSVLIDAILNKNMPRRHEVPEPDIVKLVASDREDKHTKSCSC